MVTPPAFLVTGHHYKITYTDNSLLTGIYNGGTDPHGWICLTPVEENSHSVIWVRLEEVRTITVLPHSRSRRSEPASLSMREARPAVKPAKRKLAKAAKKAAGTVVQKALKAKKKK
ncbi:MAG TPA: hypothetical protein VGN52_18805 [Burkholderiales bacterium]|jgi:hypothetical protein